MRTITIDGTLETLSPLVHFGDEKTGSSPTLHTLAVYCPAYNEIIDLPVISGNAIRGMLRRLLMHDMLHRIHYQCNSIKLHHILFTGGVLESTNETTGALDLALKNRVRETIPPVALFGCAIGNQMIHGRLIVEFAFPVCLERKDYLPADLQADPRAQRPAREFTTFNFKTRRDDLKAEREADEQAVQMKVDYESFVVGALFTHKFHLNDPTDLELSCFAHLLSLWQHRPYAGGKLASGHGQLRIHYNCPYTADAYLDYLANHAQTIVDLLNELGGKFGAS